MGNDNYDFSLIIPVHNEILVIEKTLQELLQIREKQNFEIIVVDDCSDDGSYEHLDLKQNKAIKIIRHGRNLGYGAAIKTGIRNSESPIIAITDADGTYPNKRISELVNTLKKGDYDMVVGARTGANKNVPIIRRPAKWIINKLANFLTGIRIPDLNSGLRVMKKELLEKFLHILPDGFSFTSTITLCMLTNGFNVEYIQIDYFKRVGRSKIRPIRDTFNFFQLLLRTTLYFNPLKIYIPLCISLLVLAGGVLFGSWYIMGKVMDVTFGVIVMTAVFVLSIGMLADLIVKRIE